MNNTTKYTIWMATILSSLVAVGWLSDKSSVSTAIYVETFGIAMFYTLVVWIVLLSASGLGLRFSQYNAHDVAIKLVASAIVGAIATTYFNPLAAGHTGYIVSQWIVIATCLAADLIVTSES